MRKRCALWIVTTMVASGLACRGRLPQEPDAPPESDPDAPPEPDPEPTPVPWAPGTIELRQRVILDAPSGLHPGDIASPVWGRQAFYTSRDGDEMLGLQGLSDDGGETWSPFTLPEPTVPEGSRRWVYSDWVDPVEDLLVQSVLALDVPTDPNNPEPIEGLAAYYMLTRVSADRGRTYPTEELVQQEGQSAAEPFPGIPIGGSGYFLGDVGSRPVRTSAGEILLPLQFSPQGPEGGRINPGGGYTYTHALIARGHWTAEGALRWHGSAVINADPLRTTRGMLEPTIAELPDGTLLCIMRGSNGGALDPDFQIPSHRWASTSEDGGATWSTPEPWRTDDGELFFSPSSMSALLMHSNGRVYWTGNINTENPQGNLPRDHLYLGEVDPDGQLVRSTLLLVDGPRDDDENGVSISHVLPFEDRRTGNIIIPTWRYDGDYADAAPVRYVIGVPAD